MEVLASSVYDATPAANGGAFPQLCAVAKISRHLVGYLAYLSVVTLEGLLIRAPQASLRRTPMSLSGS